MSKINKIFIIIISTFVMMFYKVYQVLALEIPSASYPSSLNYIKTTPNWFFQMKLVGWGLLLIVLPIFVVLGIIAFRNMKEQEKGQHANSNINNDYVKKEITKKFKRITRWIIVILIIAIVFIIATIIISNKYSYKYTWHAYDTTLVYIVIMDIVAIVVAIVWSLSRDKEIRKTQQTHQQQKQNEDLQLGNQPNTINQNNQRNNIQK